MNYEAEEKGVPEQRGGHALFRSRYSRNIQTAPRGWWDKAPEFGKLAEVKGMETLFLVRMIHKS